jgi:hypothetical protein
LPRDAFAKPTILTSNTIAMAIGSPGDRDGLSGGTFLYRPDAIRFALFETGGDATYVHEARTVRHRGRR